MAQMKRKQPHGKPELFSDVDDLIRELRRLHRIVGTRLVVDPEKVRMLKSSGRRVVRGSRNNGPRQHGARKRRS